MTVKCDNQQSTSVSEIPKIKKIDLVTSPQQYLDMLHGEATRISNMPGKQIYWPLGPVNAIVAIYDDVTTWKHIPQYIGHL